MSYSESRPGRRERELLERERERERYNRMVQGQGIYRDRRRCMALSPTRLQTRSPHLQYIHRGRANVLYATSPTSPSSNNNAPSPTRPTAPIPFSSSPSPPSSVSAISPDTEPMFQMSPVAVHCLPSLRNAEPINVMTLRNCAGSHPHPAARSRLRPAKSTRAAVPPLLYTFPRPNPNPKPKKENSISQLASIKKPFGLVSQNQSAEPTSSELEPAPAASSLFLDLSLTSSHPRPPSNKHIRIAHDPLTTQRRSLTKRKPRVLTPMPSPKVLDTPKPVLTNITVSRTTRLASPIPSPTRTTHSPIPPLKRIPSSPIPIPYHTPRKEDTGLFEDVSVSVNSNGGRGNDDDDHTDDLKLNATAAATRRNPNVNDTATRYLNDDRSKQDPIPSNCLGLGLPFSPIPLPDSDTPSQTQGLPFHQARSSTPTGNIFYYPVPSTHQCTISSSLSPKVGFALESSSSCPSGIDGDGISDQAGVWEPSKARMHTSARKRRPGSKELELTNAEYFEGSVEPSLDPESSFVPALSQRFESLEPVFPAFSIAQNSDLNFGQGMDNSCLQLDPDRTMRTSEFDNSENVFLRGEPEAEDPNPWLSSTFSSSSTNPNSLLAGPTPSPSPSPDSIRTFPPLQLRLEVPNSDFAPLSQPEPEVIVQNFRNGKANLEVFNPPQMPPFGDVGSVNSSCSTSSSESEQFLSFPIPIFNSDIPHAAPSAITNMLVRLPGSGTTNSAAVPVSPQASESEPLPIPVQEDEILHANASEEKGTSYRSSVYGGCRDRSNTPEAVPQGASTPPKRSSHTTSSVSPSISPLLHQNPFHQNVEMQYPTPTPTRVNSPTQGEKKREGYTGFLKKLGIGTGKS